MLTPDGWWLIQRGVADDKAEATPMEAACRARPGGRAEPGGFSVSCSSHLLELTKD